MQRAILVLATVGAAAGIVVAASSGQTPASGKTIAVYSKPPGDYHTKFIDLPPKATKKNPNAISTGDIIFQTVRLHNKTGQVIGTEYDELTFVTPSLNMNSVDLVRTVFVFADGRIFATGLHGPHFNLNDTDSVIGGTGAYAGARGTLTSGGADEDLIHLLP